MLKLYLILQILIDLSPKQKNKKVIGLMKDELSEKTR